MTLFFYYCLKKLNVNVNVNWNTGRPTWEKKWAAKLHRQVKDCYSIIAYTLQSLEKYYLIFISSNYEKVKNTG